MDSDYSKHVSSKITELITFWGETHLIPTHSIADVHQVLVSPPGLDEETVTYVDSLIHNLLASRRDYLSQELENVRLLLPQDRNQESLERKVNSKNRIKPQSLPLDPFPVDTEALKEAMMGGGNGKNDSVKIYQKKFDGLLTEEEAKEALGKIVPSPLLERVYDFMGKKKSGRDVYVFSDHVDKFIELFPNYIPLDLKQVQDQLSDSYENIVSIVSSYPDTTVLDFVKIINPYDRIGKCFYAMGKKSSMDEILPGLEAIQHSLQEGHSSYRDVSVIVRRKKLMESNHPLFEPVIETCFNRRDDGTYEKDSVEQFLNETEGYRFKMLKRIFNNDSETIALFLKMAASYEGHLLKRVDVSGAPSLKDCDPTELYLFKCDEKGIIDIGMLTKKVWFS